MNVARTRTDAAPLPKTCNTVLRSKRGLPRGTVEARSLSWSEGLARRAVYNSFLANASGAFFYLLPEDHITPIEPGVTDRPTCTDGSTC